jgi:hypothetical protein
MTRSLRFEVERLFSNRGDAPVLELELSINSLEEDKAGVRIKSQALQPLK